MTTFTYSGGPPPESSDEPINRRRYFRITGFFARVIFHVIFWDLLVKRVGFMRRRILSSRPNRYRKISRKFRGLAVDMGGVMIKLGQFLSARVDVLPLEITEELRGLQDEVPPVDQKAIEAVIEQELGNTDRFFERIERQPLAAASFGQTHRAWLKSSRGGYGRSVVVKVQRPEIEKLVRTDMAALRRVARWVMRYKPIRNRANVPSLMEEFGVTLWEELDYRAEVVNADRFRDIFADYEGLYVPKFYHEHCTGRVLVMENVESYKVTDVEELRELGVDTAQVADRLLDVYFQQVFEQSYFHADPHPGNIFIRPKSPQDNGDPTPFDIIFIDFGMMGRIPEDTTDLLQKLLVSVTTRDSRGYIESVEKLGFFLPGADLDRMMEAHERVLDQIWGRDLTTLANPDMEEVKEISKEFKDILFEFPFQVPQNFIYLGRALGILSGISSMLNPDINPWVYIDTYGRKLLRSRRVQEASVSMVTDTLRSYAALPARLARVLESAESGKLKVQFKPDRKTEMQLDRLEKRTRQINGTILATATLISGTMLYLGDEQTLGYIFWGLTGLTALWTNIRNRMW